MSLYELRCGDSGKASIFQTVCCNLRGALELPACRKLRTFHESVCRHLLAPLFCFWPQPSPGRAPCHIGAIFPYIPASLCFVWFVLNTPLSARGRLDDFCYTRDSSPARLRDASPCILWLSRAVFRGLTACRSYESLPCGDNGFCSDAGETSGHVRMRFKVLKNVFNRGNLRTPASFGVDASVA